MPKGETSRPKNKAERKLAKRPTNKSEKKQLAKAARGKFVDNSVGVASGNAAPRGGKANPFGNVTAAKRADRKAGASLDKAEAKRIREAIAQRAKRKRAN